MSSLPEEPTSLARCLQKGLVIAVLGLVSEASTIANVIKKYLRDGISWESQRELLRIELGDVLWYFSNVAFRLGISLDEVASENLLRTRDRHGVLGRLRTAGMLVGRAD